MGEVRGRDDLTRARLRLRHELCERGVREAGEVGPQLALDDNQPVDELDRVGRLRGEMGGRWGEAPHPASRLRGPAMTPLSGNSMGSPRLLGHSSLLRVGGAPQAEPYLPISPRISPYLPHLSRPSCRLSAPVAGVKDGAVDELALVVHLDGALARRHVPLTLAQRLHHQSGRSLHRALLLCGGGERLGALGRHSLGDFCLLLAKERHRLWHVLGQRHLRLVAEKALADAGEHRVNLGRLASGKVAELPAMRSRRCAVDEERFAMVGHAVRIAMRSGLQCHRPTLKPIE